MNRYGDLKVVKETLPGNVYNQYVDEAGYTRTCRMGPVPTKWDDKKEHWGLEPASNSLCYDKAKRQFSCHNNRFYTEKDKGRYYTLSREKLNSLNS